MWYLPFRLVGRSLLPLELVTYLDVLFCRLGLVLVGVWKLGIQHGASCLAHGSTSVKETSGRTHACSVHTCS